MGFREVDAVIESNLKNPVKAVAIALAKHVNSKTPDTEIWPSLPTLVRLSGCCQRTVQRSIEKLEEQNVLETTFEGNGRQSSRYLFHLSNLSVGSAATPNNSGAAERPLRVGSGATQCSTGDLADWVEGSPSGYSEAAQRLPNREENRESAALNLESKREAEAAAVAAARSQTNLKELERKVLDYWYGIRLKKSIGQVEPSRIQQDLPFVQELISVMNGQSQNILTFVFTDPGEGDWAGWDKKTPNLQSLIKHIRKGDLIQQFHDSPMSPQFHETHSSALPLCDACGQAAENLTEFKVTYQTEPKRYCESCLAEGEEDGSTVPSDSRKKKVARATAMTEAGVLAKNIVVDEL